MKTYICDRCKIPMTRPNILRIKWAAGERTRLELCDECAEKIHRTAKEIPTECFITSYKDMVRTIQRVFLEEDQT